MPSIWDLLPASAWTVQPFVWPLDPTQPSPGTHTVLPQPPGSSAPAFGWAPAAAASTPAFGWASASPAPPNALAYSGATDPGSFFGAPPHAEVDPTRTARLSEDARRAYELTRWAFGPASHPARQTRELAAGPDVSASRFMPTAAAVDAVDAPPRSSAMSGVDDAGSRPAPADVPVPANWADQWDVPVVNPDVAPVGTVSDPQAPPVAPLARDLIAATPPARLSAQERYHRAQAGDESFAPEFVRTGPTYPEAIIDSWAEAGRIRTTPPLPLPKGARAEDDEGRTWSRGTADPAEREAFVADNQARAELPMRIALAMLRGGVGFAQRGSLGTGSGRLRPPPLTGQLHHGISKPVHKALEGHGGLKGAYEHRDARFVTQAFDKDAHNGYQQWHRSLDSEIAKHIRNSPGMTPEEFEEFLRARYKEPDLIARFPKGL
jgi:hypothetical protein